MWSSIVAGRRPSSSELYKPKQVPGTTITLHAMPQGQGHLTPPTSNSPLAVSPKLPASPASSGVGSYQSPGQVSPGQVYPWHLGSQGHHVLSQAHMLPGHVVHSPWQQNKTDSVKGKSEKHEGESGITSQSKTVLGSENASESKNTKVTFTLTDSESSRSSESGFSEHVSKTPETYASVCSHCQTAITEEKGHSGTNKVQKSVNLPEKQGGKQEPRNNSGNSERPYGRGHMEPDRHYKDKMQFNKDRNDQEGYSYSRRDYDSHYRGRGRGQGRGQGYHDYNRGHGYQDYHRHQINRDHYNDQGRHHDQNHGRRYTQDQQYERGRGPSHYRDRGHANYRGQNQRFPHRGRGRGKYDFHVSQSEPSNNMQKESPSYDKTVNIRRAVSAQEGTNFDRESMYLRDNSYSNQRDRTETGSNSDFSDSTQRMSDLTLEQENKPKERTSSDTSDKKSDTLFRSTSNEGNQTSSSNSGEWCNVTKKSGKKKGWVDSPDNYAQDKRYSSDRYRDRTYSQPSRHYDKRGRGRGNRFYETGERDRQRYGRGFERNERPS